MSAHMGNFATFLFPLNKMAQTQPGNIKRREVSNIYESTMNETFFSHLQVIYHEEQKVDLSLKNPAHPG